MAPLATASPSRPAPAGPPRRRSRAKPKPPRMRFVVVTELRGLGGLVLEQALLDGTAKPRPDLVIWADRLAAELDVQGVGEPVSNRELLHAINHVNRRSLADPDRPTVAIPAAV